jgi:hypothetical protein
VGGFHSLVDRLSTGVDVSLEGEDDGAGSWIRVGGS